LVHKASFLRSFKNNHLWLSIIIRHPREHFNSVDRTLALYGWIGGVFIVNAAFWALDPQIAPTNDVNPIWQEWRIAIIAAFIAWIPSLTIVWCFQMPAIENEGPQKSLFWETCCTCSLFRAFGVLYAFGWMGCTVIVVLFLGLQFDRSYGSNPNDSAWRWLRTSAYSNVLDFVLLRTITAIFYYVKDTCTTPERAGSFLVQHEEAPSDAEAPKLPSPVHQPSQKPINEEVANLQLVPLDVPIRSPEPRSDDEEEEEDKEEEKKEAGDDPEARVYEGQLSSENLYKAQEEQELQEQQEQQTKPKKKGKKKKKGKSKKKKDEERGFCAAPKIRECFGIETPAQSQDPANSNDSSCLIQ